MYSILCHSPSPAPPLTFDNLYSVLEEVKEEWRNLSHWLGVYDATSDQYDSNEAALKDILESFLQLQHNSRTWRTVILALDRMGKVHVADKIMSFAEPVQGGCGYFSLSCVYLQQALKQTQYCVCL